jgi:hypothetical protein
MTVIINVVLSAMIIGVAAWLSGKFPRGAGFLVALPLATMLVLPMAYYEHRDIGKTVDFAWSILIAVPVIMLFLIPFVLALRWAYPSGRPTLLPVFGCCQRFSFIVVLCGFFRSGAPPNNRSQRATLRYQPPSSSS